MENHAGIAVDWAFLVFLSQILREARKCARLEAGFQMDASRSGLGNFRLEAQSK